MEKSCSPADFYSPRRNSGEIWSRLRLKLEKRCACFYGRFLMSHGFRWVSADSWSRSRLAFKIRTTFPINPLFDGGWRRVCPRWDSPVLPPSVLTAADRRKCRVSGFFSLAVTRQLPANILAVSVTTGCSLASTVSRKEGVQTRLRCFATLFGAFDSARCCPLQGLVVLQRSVSAL